MEQIHWTTILVWLCMISACLSGWSPKSVPEAFTHSRSSATAADTLYEDGLRWNRPGTRKEQERMSVKGWHLEHYLGGWLFFSSLTSESLKPVQAKSNGTHVRTSWSIVTRRRTSMSLRRSECRECWNLTSDLRLCIFAWFPMFRKMCVSWRLRWGDFPQIWTIEV